jgi:hypothetical protein
MFFNPFFHKPDLWYKHHILNSGMIIQIGLQPEHFHKYGMAKVHIQGRGKVFDNYILEII